MISWEVSYTKKIATLLKEFNNTPQKLGVDIINDNAKNFLELKPISVD